MFGLIVLFAISYFFLWLFHFIWTNRFVSHFSSARQRELPRDEELPRTLVMLCLRGPDPFLCRTLEQLGSQSYSNFDLRIVIDHEQDPAFQIVDDFLSRQPDSRIQVRILKERLKTCSLKSSALIQELSELDEQYQAVVMIDADAVPHQEWLREMLAPLADPSVGVVSGHRWYMPKTASFPALIRYIWGASGDIQMHQFNMPWGGSLAIRREVIEQTDLLKRWSERFIEDLTISEVLERSSWKVGFAPVVLVNKENISFKGCFEFIRRQTFCVRTHHKSWPLIAGYALLSCLTLTGALSLVPISIYYGQWYYGVVSFLVGVVYLCGFLTTLLEAEKAVRRKIADQRMHVEPFHWQVVLAAPATLYFYTASVLSAMMIHRLSWRGITYDVKASGEVRFLEDKPYLPPVSELAEASVL